MNWPTDKQELLELGRTRLKEICETNSLPVPPINVISKADWPFGVCAFYRPDTGATRKWAQPGISICLEKCQTPMLNSKGQNWTWPGYTVDREPYGVIMHECGHHFDWHAGKKKGSYYSEFSSEVMEQSGEEKLTNYCDNPAEWWAEMFRLFGTNPGLLKVLRPKTYAIILGKWEPVGEMKWMKALGDNVPARNVIAIENKIKALGK